MSKILMSLAGTLRTNNGWRSGFSGSELSGIGIWSLEAAGQWVGMVDMASGARAKSGFMFFLSFASFYDTG